MSDVCERLKARSAHLGKDSIEGELMNDAITEIERLQAEAQDFRYLLIDIRAGIRPIHSNSEILIKQIDDALPQPPQEPK